MAICNGIGLRLVIAVSCACGAYQTLGRDTCYAMRDAVCVQSSVKPPDGQMLCAWLPACSVLLRLVAVSGLTVTEVRVLTLETTSLAAPPLTVVTLLLITSMDVLDETAQVSTAKPSTPQLRVVDSYTT